MSEPNNEADDTQTEWNDYVRDEDAPQRPSPGRPQVSYAATAMVVAAAVVAGFVVNWAAQDDPQESYSVEIQAPVDTRDTRAPARRVAPAPEPTLRTSTTSVPRTIIEPAATTTTLHPQVQAQGAERVNVIVERYAEAWPWTAQAFAAAQMSFFEDLPEACNSNIGCYSHATGEIWLSLDALRPKDPDPFSYFYSTRGPSDIVLHELAHAYTRSFPQGAELLDSFAQHYAGCYGHGLDNAVFAEELLADTLAMIATSAGSRVPDDYGYFDDGGFAGCLTVSDRPKPALVLDVYSALFNCSSEHALKVFDNHHKPSLFWRIRPALGADGVSGVDAVLLSCYGIDCVTTDRECVNLTENDVRQDLAAGRLHERRCVDGVLESVTGWSRPGWEPGCETFIPDDVECTVGLHGRLIGFAAGVLTAANECVEPNCDVENSQETPQRGYRKHSWSLCEAIDRPTPP